jgi:hypothetical protein
MLLDRAAVSRSQNCLFLLNNGANGDIRCLFCSPHICEVDISVSPHSIKEKFIHVLKCVIPLQMTSGAEIGNPRANSPPKTKFSYTYLFISFLFLERENRLMFLSAKFLRHVRYVVVPSGASRLILTRCRTHLGHVTVIIMSKPWR